MIQGDLMQVRFRGEIMWRRISEFESPPETHGVRRAVPQTSENEEIVWILGDELPTILET